MLLLLATLACRTKDDPIDTAIPDADLDGVPWNEDCDDNDPDVGLPTAWYADADGDGFGAGVEVWNCNAPSGTVDNGDDCDDNDAAIYPLAPEEDCTDPVDYNCDGSVGYADADGDGYAACEECNDAERAVNPSATEVCDEVDNDCDGEVDVNAVDADTFYTDADADGFGDPDAPVLGCSQPEGAVDDDEDCDDTLASVNPDADELCNDIDDDCDGDIDIDATDAPVWYADADGDSYGNAAFSYTECDQPGGTVDNADDCDDGEALAWTGATESCDEVDNDCNGTVDEGVTTTFYGDGDQDGYGDDTVTTEACSQPAYYATVGGDCDDTDADYSPGATEGCDGEDYNCDGAMDNDADVDGYPDVSCGGDDCDDTDNTVNPAATEVCEDGIDNDCDGTSGSCGWDGESVVTDADAIFQGEASGDRAAGYGVGGADFNGDGYSDLAIGALFHDANGSDSGVVYIVEGPVTGTLGLGSADYELAGEGSADRFGRSIVTADTDGDGYDDLVVSATHDDDGGSNAGAVWLFRGPLTSMNATDADAKFIGEASTDIVGDIDAADFDGDGYDDFLIAAQYNDAGGANAGAVYIVTGTTTGDLDLSSATAKFVGEAAGDEAGSALRSAGDTDGDGNVDALVGARFNDNGASNAGSVYLLLGPATGTIDLSNADTTLEAKHASDYVGGDISVSGTGDLNDDGYDDIMVGAGGDDDNGTDAGAVYLYFGPLSSGSASVLTYDHKILGEATGDGAGRSVTPLGDVDGDGSPDLLIASIFEDSGATNAGAAYLVLGPATGISDLADAKAKFTGTGSADYLGHHSLANAGDVDGDGYNDWLVGTPVNDDVATDAGSAYLFMGSGI
jgi:hypothetical protein